MPETRYTRTSRALNEGFVEGDKRGVPRPATQVHRVGKFNSVRRECQRRGYRRFILRLHILEAEQLRECVTNRALLKSVQAAEHPAGFEQHRFRDPDWLGCKQGSRRGLLLGVVASQQADQYVSIDRDHDVAVTSRPMAARICAGVFDLRLDRRQPATSSRFGVGKTGRGAEQNSFAGLFDRELPCPVPTPGKHGWT